MPASGKPGFRVLPAPPRLPAELVARFRGLASSNLADAMGRFNFMNPAIQSRSALPLCGLAVTVNARPADNLMVHKALQVAKRGDTKKSELQGASKSMEASMTEKELEELASTKRKGKPEHVG